MNCYYSTDLPAIGICKSCGKGLSSEYAVDVGNGLACKNNCEERVRLINRIIDSNSKVLLSANKQLLRNTIFMIIIGLLFVGMGVFTGSFGSHPTGIILCAMGGVFVLRGIFGYTRSVRYPTVEKTPNSPPNDPSAGC